MKKILNSTAFIATVLFSATVFAADPTPSAQTKEQPNMNIMTIEEVQGLGDNAPVVLEGMVVETLGDENYMFKDPSGASIIVEIDNEDWLAVQPSPNDMVIITGETDKDGNTTEIEVETIALKK